MRGMMSTAANTAGGKSGGDCNNEATAAILPPAKAGRAWPTALRIDIELAENHARKMGVGGGCGRINEKNRPKTTPLRGPSKQSRQVHHSKCSLAEDYGGDDKTRKEVAVGRRVDVRLEDSQARAEGGPAVLATGGIEQLRDLLENGRHSGVITRQTGRRSTARGSEVPKNMLVDGEDTNMAHSDGVPRTLGCACGGGGNGDKANDASCSTSTCPEGIMSKKESHYWSGQEGVAMAGGAEPAVSAAVRVSSESREGQGRIKRLRHGGVREYERRKVGDDDGRRDLAISPPPSFPHHQLEPRIGINGEEVHGREHHLVGPSTMYQLVSVMSEALATVAMASAVSAAAESTLVTDGKALDTQPAPPAAARATPASAAPPHPQGQNSDSKFREADAAYMELREYANEIEGRLVLAIKALHAASRAVVSPGKELHRSYEAYSHAHRSLQAAESSVRDAEELEDAAVDELHGACEALDAAEGEVARAAKTLRVFDAGRGSDKGDASSKHETVKKKHKSDGGDDGDCDGSGGKGAQPRALSNEAGPLQISAHVHSKSRPTRESLSLALETGRSNAERASVEKYRAQKEAVAAMTLVGARTAGEWSLAAQEYDMVKRRFRRAGLEAIPKIKLFSDEARLFRNLNKLRGDTSQRLSAAYQIREAARVKAAEGVAMAVARRMSTTVAHAVTVKAAAEAAARATSLSEPATGQEEVEGKEEQEHGKEDGRKETVKAEEGARQWVVAATPWRFGEERGGKKEG